MRLPCPAPRCLTLLLCAVCLAACSSDDAAGGALSAGDAIPEAGGYDAPAALPEAGSEDATDAPSSADAAEDAVAADGPGGDGDACKLARAYSQLDPECNDCAERECCVEINGCLLDPACDDSFVNCMLACALEDDGDAGTMQACIDGCTAQYPTGKAEYDVAIGCADSKCATECE